MDAEHVVTETGFDPERDYEVLQRARERVSAAVDKPYGSQLQALYSFPDLLPLLASIRFEVGEFDTTLDMDDAGCIRIPASALQVPAALAVRLRHGLERQAWRRAADATCVDVEWVSCLLSLHATLHYLNLLAERDRAAAWAGLPHSLAQAFDEWTSLQNGGASDEARVTWLGAHADLMEQGPVPAPKDPRRAAEIVTAGLVVALPVEELLTTGGDERLRLAPETALNKYGCSPKPRPWAATFSTCTASSISAPAFRAAEFYRRALLGSVYSGAFEQGCATRMQALRRALGETLGLDQIPGSEVVLTASGTDAELLAIYCATAGRSQDVSNVILAPTEVGSGTVHAAGGRHFDPTPPLATAVVPGEAVAGFDAQRIRVIPMDIRDANGGLRDPAAVDQALRRRVEQEIGEGRLTIVHLLDCSKTGFGAPTLDVLLELKQRYPRDLTVIVDAAQMRLSRRVLHRYIQAGFLVIATGSKFFTGPPFSGALLVPSSLSPVGGAALPEGLADYCARCDFPPSWAELTKTLPRAVNLGLMLRWSAALWELRAFFVVPARERRAIFQEFAQRMQSHLSSVAEVTPLPAEVYRRQYPHDQDDWDQVQTIFSFYVHRPAPGQGRAQCISYDDAVRVYHWLNTDIEDLLPDTASAEECALARHCCHIGQPVRVQSPEGRWCGALRIAVGARLVSRVAFDRSLGISRADRIRQQEQSARQVLDKIAVICRYWPRIADANPARRAHAGADPDPVEANQATATE